MSRPKVHESKPDPIPSIAVIDPTMRLAAAGIARAFEDLRGADLVAFVDSLTWLLCGDAPLWLEAIGYQKDYSDLLQWIVEANHGQKARITPN